MIADSSTIKNIRKLEVSFPNLTSTEPILLPKNLEHLDLSYSYFDVSNVFSHLNSLKTLYLSEIDITDATLKCITDSCLRLQTLLIYCKCLKLFKKVAFSLPLVRNKLSKYFHII